MLDTSILSACMDSREAYNKVCDHVDTDELSPQGAVWWPIIKSWYDKDSKAKKIDRDLLRDKGKRVMDARHHDSLLGWYDDLPASTSPDNVADELLALKRGQQGLILCSEIQKLQDKPDKLIPRMDQYIELLKASSLGVSRSTEASFDTMMDTLDDSHKLPIAPSKLNDVTGGAVPGDVILIFARPEMGKSLFAVNMACGFAKTGHKVLYIANEEHIDKYYMRMACNLLNTTEDKIKERPEEAKKALMERGLQNIVARHLEPGTVPEIEALVEDHKPSVLFVDQIRNLDSPGKNLTEKMETSAKQLRNMMSRHSCVGVWVTQAGDKTERYGQEAPFALAMSDIDSSRTGLPAAADLIIGIGATNDHKVSNKRFLSLPKNKLGNVHTGFLVEVDEGRSRVR